MMISETSGIVPVNGWMSEGNDMLLIAGPCSVESRNQLLSTARGIAAIEHVQILRAGVWKPRSKPGQFEGAGAIALPWLKEIANESGLQTAVEVAQPGHAEQCLKHGIDILWLGARTSVNPFMVQEIANAIRGTQIPVMIKNPVCPDLNLWIGAIERIMRAGTKKIIAIHRGFQSHQKSIYRNLPLWNIPLALKKEIPGIPLVCDPSHIAGNKDLLADIASQALAFDMDGLMIEVHHNPGKALTDRLQQISPSMLKKLINVIMHRKQTGDPEQKLAALRYLIDETDFELLDVLAKRMNLTQEIGKLKKISGTGVLQPDRQKQIFTDRLERAGEIGLNAEFVKQLLQLLHEESVAVQLKSNNIYRNNLDSQ